MRRFDLLNQQNFARLRRGPLAPELDPFAALLTQQGYSRQIAWTKMRLVADLSHWMDQRRVAPKQLDEEQVATFLKARWRRVPPRSGDRATLALLLRHLRQSNVIPTASPPAPRSDIEHIELEYRDHLLHERSLMPTSVETYLPVARRFLSHRFRNGKVWLKKLGASDITDFVLNDTANRGRRSAQLMTSVLRSFLGFLLQHGRISTNLAAAVPTVAGWRLSELPRFLESEQIERVLRCCDRRRKAGKRDYAILLLLARLGLRAGEVAYLTLEDIDWRAGELRIRGKGTRVDRLPLPKDVGQALATYLQKARANTSSRRVFIQNNAPHEPLTGPGSISNIVRAALARAQIHARHQGAHLLRHSTAMNLLQHGVDRSVIALWLGHESMETTQIYLHANLELKELALAKTEPFKGRNGRYRPPEDILAFLQRL